MRILLTGGGTGGHIAPILAVVSEIKNIACEKNIQEIEFMLITPDEHFREALKKAGIKVEKIKAGKLRRYFDMKNISDIVRIFIGITQSIFIIQKFKPDVVFSKGGFASVPAVFASWILGIPIVTHESDIVPGLANKINSFFASKVLVSFEETQKYFKKGMTIITGNPVREDVLVGDAERGIQTFNLCKGIPILLIFGGSQGAKKINDAVLDAIEKFLEKYQIIHLCGKNNFCEMKDIIERKKLVYSKRYHPYAFLSDEMKDAYAVSNIIVSRAGANSIAEIIEVGKPSIIIPLSASANDHQTKNAKWLSEKGLAEVLPEKDLSGEKLFEKIEKLNENEKEKGRIVKNISEYKSKMNLRPAHVIAQTILESIDLV